MGQRFSRRNKLWQARWDVYYSVKALIKNGRVYSTDVCLPISKITECVKFMKRNKKIWAESPNGGTPRRREFSCDFAL